MICFLQPLQRTPTTKLSTTAPIARKPAEPGKVTRPTKVMAASKMAEKNGIVDQVATINVEVNAGGGSGMELAKDNSPITTVAPDNNLVATD